MSAGFSSMGIRFWGGSTGMRVDCEGGSTSTRRPGAACPNTNQNPTPLPNSMAIAKNACDRAAMRFRSAPIALAILADCGSASLTASFLSTAYRATSAAAILLRDLSHETGRKQQELIAEALNMLFVKHGKRRVAS